MTHLWRDVQTMSWIRTFSRSKTVELYKEVLFSFKQLVGDDPQQQKREERKMEKREREPGLKEK